MNASIYFITGVTGFLSKEFLVTALTDNPQAQFYCLIRQQGRTSAEQRLKEVLQSVDLSHESHRVFAIPGDITHSLLGLEVEVYQTLARKITHIVHSAALVQFEKPKAMLEHINVEGTKNMIAFAQESAQLNPEFKVFAYVSTAYVAGQRKGRVTEQDFSDAYGFKNNYESTKFAAEALLHAKKATIPLIIFRPSIILGHSQSGRTPRNNVIFPPTQVVKKFPLPFALLPINENCLLDFVPVDYVANGIYSLMHMQEAYGQTFHLTSGMGKEVSMGQALQVFSQMYGVRLISIPAGTWPLLKRLFSLTRIGRYVVQAADPFWLYSLENPQFCQQYTQQFLDKQGLSCDNMVNVLKKTLIFMEN